MNCIMDSHLVNRAVMSSVYTLMYAHIPYDELPASGKAVRRHWFLHFFTGLPEELLEKGKTGQSEQLYDSRSSYYYALLAKLINFEKMVELVKSANLNAILTPRFEQDPLFESVRGHYEKTELWESTSKYKAVAGKYSRSVLAIITL